MIWLFLTYHLHIIPVLFTRQGNIFWYIFLNVSSIGGLSICPVTPESVSNFLGWEQGLKMDYCFGKEFARVLTQDSVLLHGVIAFVRTHSHAHSQKKNVEMMWIFHIYWDFGIFHLDLRWCIPIIFDVVGFLVNCMWPFQGGWSLRY